MEHVITVLAILVCAEAVALYVCNSFWSAQVEKLVDRVMSKNYAEYTQVQTNAAQEQFPKEHRVQVQTNAEDLGTLDGVNVY